MKHNKLLNKILPYYLICGLLATFLITTAFYLFMLKYHIHEIDQVLLVKREIIVEKNIPTLKSEIEAWNRFNSDETILPDVERTENDVFTTEYIFNEYGKREEPHRILYSRIEIEGEKFILAIKLNFFEAQKILQFSVLLALLLFVGIAAGVMVITRLMNRKLWNPFYQTLSIIEQFNIQQNEVPHFPPVDTEEFKQLNLALEKSMDNNLQAYIIQKDFAKNTAQEMQTPLAVFRSTLDMLLKLHGLTKEQTEMVQTVYEESLQLVHMNRNLMMLVQLDNQQFPDTQLLNIADIVAESLSSHSEQAEAANLTVETYLIDRSLNLHADKSLLESLINNLINNSIQHNLPNGRILVTLHGNRLDIVNTSAGEPLDYAILFRRFGRMDTATKGGGLGLAIAQQICSLYGWQILYGFAGGMHRFTVNFVELPEFIKPDRLLT